MQDPMACPVQHSGCTPWNKGKLIGAKPPLRQKHVWAIRSKLQVEGQTRDLAMFNLAIDSKLRGCDLVSLRVEDIAPHGRALDRTTVRQKMTGRPVRFELTEQTREALEAYIERTSKHAGRVADSSATTIGRVRGTCRENTPHPARCSRHSQRAALSHKGRGEASMRLPNGRGSRPLKPRTCRSLRRSV